MSALIATLTIDQHGSLLELVLQHLDDGPYAWPSPHLVQSKGVCKLFAQLARRLLLKRWSLARAMVLPWMPHRLDAMLNWHREVNAMLKSTQWHGRGPRLVRNHLGVPSASWRLQSSLWTIFPFGDAFVTDSGADEDMLRRLLGDICNRCGVDTSICKFFIYSPQPRYSLPPPPFGKWLVEQLWIDDDFVYNFVVDRLSVVVVEHTATDDLIWRALRKTEMERYGPCVQAVTRQRLPHFSFRLYTTVRSRYGAQGFSTTNEELSPPPRVDLPTADDWLW